MSTASQSDSPSEPNALMMPSSLTGGRGVAFGAFCGTVLLAILALELLVRPYGSLGALTVVPVAVAAWLLSRRGALLIVVLALVVRAFGVAVGGVDAVTAGAEALVLIIVAVAIRQAGSLLMRWRDAESHLRDQRARFAVLAERERIGSQVYENAIHALIGATLRLQSAVSMIDQPAPRGRVQATIADLDQLVIQLRQTILKPETGLPASAFESEPREQAEGQAPGTVA